MLKKAAAALGALLILFAFALPAFANSPIPPTLAVYTDGLPEATDADNQFFGMERTLAALNRAPDAGPEQVIANMKEAVDDFVKKAEQFDDLTMMCFRYLGPAGKKE